MDAKVTSRINHVELDYVSNSHAARKGCNSQIAPHYRCNVEAAWPLAHAPVAKEWADQEPAGTQKGWSRRLEKLHAERFHPEAPVEGDVQTEDLVIPSSAEKVP